MSIKHLAVVEPGPSAVMLNARTVPAQDARRASRAARWEHHRADAIALIEAIFSDVADALADGDTGGAVVLALFAEDARDSTATALGNLLITAAGHAAPVNHARPSYSFTRAALAGQLAASIERGAL